MGKNKSLLAVGVVLIVCLIVIGFSSSIQGRERSYRIRPEIILPEYRTDSSRAIDAYERVMDRLMNLTEKNLTGINTDVKSIAKKLVLIDRKLTDISTRMARIERTLSIGRIERHLEKPREAERSDNADKADSKGQK